MSFLGKLFDSTGASEITIAHGEIFSLQKKAKLTALEDSIVGVPSTLVVGEPNIGSVVHHDPDVKMWGKEGTGHPSLGVLIHIGLPAGKWVWLSKASSVVIYSPEGTHKETMRFRLQ